MGRNREALNLPWVVLVPLMALLALSMFLLGRAADDQQQKAAENAAKANQNAKVVQVTDEVVRAECAKPNRSSDLDRICKAISNATAQVTTAPVDPKQGEQGPMGPVGPPGADGADGADGAPGKDGEPGQPGSNGSPGQNGAPGVNGQPGTNGVDGTNGTDGVNGVDGQPGAPGAQGPQGQPGADSTIPGPAGSSGAPGAPGAPGADGKDGSDGRGIASLSCSGGDLVVTYTDGTTATVAGSDACKPLPTVTVTETATVPPGQNK